MRGLFIPDWYTLTTGALIKGNASLPVGTYFAKIDLQGSCEFGGTFITDGVCEATATVEGNDAPSGVATDYAAVNTVGWTDESAVTDVAIAAGTTSFALGHVVEFERGRARVKLVVATPGVCSFYPTVKGA